MLDHSCNLTINSSSSSMLYRVIICPVWEWLELSRWQVWQDHNLNLQFQCLHNPSNITLDSRLRLTNRTIQLLLACNNINRTVLINIQECRLSNNSLPKSIQFHLTRGLDLAVWLQCTNAKVDYLVRAVLVPPVQWDTCHLNTNSSNINPRSSNIHLNSSTRPSLLVMASPVIQVQE